jgi:N,N'-diacetyl-8-epilegionaminate cytidylyltransferase
MKFYAFIFARKGSVRLKNKNTKMLNGVPLISHSIGLAKKIRKITKIFVSTNDEKVKKIALKEGCIVIDRPNNLCLSKSPEWKSWQHAIKYAIKKFDDKFNFISIPTTSPLRNKSDILKCIGGLKKNNDIVITISKTNLDPNFNMVYQKKNKIFTFKNLKNILMTRKNNYQVFGISTVAYVAKIKFILNKKSIFDGRISYVKIPTHRSLDIDTEYDYEIAKKFI